MKTFITCIIDLTICYIISYFTNISVYILIPFVVVSRVLVVSLVEKLRKEYIIYKFNRDMEQKFGIKLYRVK